MDFVLAGGTIVDGTGSAPWPGDVLVRGDRIVAVEPVIAAGETPRIHCTGLMVAPAFIDAHSHSDLQVLENRPEKLMQGVTSEVVGNCGFSAFPSGRNPEAVREFANGIFCGADEWHWASARDYLDQVERASASGVRALTGHGTLRVDRAGSRQGPLEQHLVDAMAEDLKESIAAGSAGLSTGLMYAPGSSAPTAELEQLCGVVASTEAIYCTHMRSYTAEVPEAIDEQLDLARATGCRLQISHLQVAGRANWHHLPVALEKIDRAAEEGIDVEFDMYPYLAGSTVLTQLLPQYALEGGAGAMVARLRDPLRRGEIAREVQGRLAQSWSDILITGVRTAENQWVVGSTLLEIATRRGADPAATVLDLVAEERGEATIVSFNQCDENLRALLTHRCCTVISDGFYVKGRPHPRLFGTFPELLGKICREKRWMTVEDAVHRITLKPARRFGMRDVGSLRAGMSADITVFDAETIGSPATYSDPAQPPVGIRLVFRQGRQVWPRPA